MAKTKEPNFEDIDDHVNDLYMQDFEKGGKYSLALTTKAAKLDPGAALASVCKAWQAAKPVVEMVQWIPFIPASWKKVIVAFAGLMNQLCPAVS